ncbi:MAG: hypothetical protein NWE89_13485 [Candidatus Bathyarchaeota archaeon]|nr:hypothetical protein [Candidatus Bathyarchaeota archaeon]
MTRLLDVELDGYRGAGFVFLVFGVVFGGYTFLVISDPLYVSLGLACVILGATILLVPDNPVPRDSVRALVEGATVNIEALLEELDVQSHAFYLPPREGRVYCYLPLSEGFDPGNLDRVMAAPLRVVTEAGGSRGVFVFPPGSEVVRLSMLMEESGVEDALSYVLVDYLEAVDGLKAVETGGNVVVEITRPLMQTEFPRYNDSMGSLVTSIAGCVVSWVLGKPVEFIGEDVLGDVVTARFRVYGG